MKERKRIIKQSKYPKKLISTKIRFFPISNEKLRIFTGHSICDVLFFDVRFSFVTLSLVLLTNKFFIFSNLFFHFISQEVFLILVSLNNSTTPWNSETVEVNWCETSNNSNKIRINVLKCLKMIRFWVEIVLH